MLFSNLENSILNLNSIRTFSINDPHRSNGEVNYINLTKIKTGIACQHIIMLKKTKKQKANKGKIFIIW